MNQNNFRVLTVVGLSSDGSDTLRFFTLDGFMGGFVLFLEKVSERNKEGTLFFLGSMLLGDRTLEYLNADVLLSLNIIVLVGFGLLLSF